MSDQPLDVVLPFDIILDSVRWATGVSGDSTWWLELRWHRIEPGPGGPRPATVVGPPGEMQIQLYRDAALHHTAGEPVDAGSSGAGTWDLKRAKLDRLEPDRQYWIAMVATFPPSNTSNALAVLHTPPTLQALRLDGDAVALTWTPPAQPPFDHYVAALGEPGGEPFGWTATIPAAACAGATPGTVCWRFDTAAVPFQDAAPAVLTLYPALSDGQEGDSRGPGASAAVLPAAPVIEATTYQGTGSQGGPAYRLTVRAPGATQPPQFDVAVSADGIPVDTVRLQSTAGPRDTWLVDLDLPAQLPGGVPVAHGAGLGVTVVRNDGVSATPSSATAPLLGDVPEITRAEYADGVLEVDVAYPPAAARHSAAVLTVRSAGKAVASTVINGESGSVAFSATPGGDYTATVHAVAGASSGPPSSPLPLLTAAPTPRTASYDGIELHATWDVPTAGSVPGLQGFRLSVDSAGVEVAAVLVGGGAGTVPIPASLDAPTLQVAMVGEVTLGPDCTPVPLLLEAPQPTGATTDPVSGACTVSWSSDPHAQGYLLQTLVDGVPGAPLSVKQTSTELPQKPTPGADLAVAVASTDSSSGVDVTGPYSAPLHLCTAVTEVLDADHDGEAVWVRWSAPADTTGSLVSLLAGNAQAPLAQGQAAAGATSLRFPAPLVDPALDYTVTVQALTAVAVGPPASPRALFEPAWFFAAGTRAPNLIPARRFPGDSIAATAHEITVELPQLRAVTAEAPAVTAGDAFSLESTGDPVFPLRLRIAGAGGLPWDFGSVPVNGIRGTLRDRYVDFLKAAEASGVLPAGIALLQLAISRSLPQTFEETLYYAYGLDVAQRFVDLRPGMVLRVCVDPYLNVPGTGTTPWINGWMGGGGLDLDVAAYTVPTNLVPPLDWLVGMDAFIARLAGVGALRVDPPRSSGDTQGGFGDAADFFTLGMRTPFARLWIPAALPKPTDNLGSVKTPEAFTVAAAPTYKALCDSTNRPDKNAVGWFRGRSVLRPMIRVQVDGMEQLVPVGTTVGNLLDRLAERPPAAPAALRGLRLERAAGPVVVDATQAVRAGRALRVRYDWKKLAVANVAGGDALALPLLHGDRLVLGG